jgi:hypothetical protein
MFFICANERVFSRVRREVARSRHRPRAFAAPGVVMAEAARVVFQPQHQRVNHPSGLFAATAVLDRRSNDRRPAAPALSHV